MRKQKLKLPGMPYEDMYDLIYQTRPQVASMFSIELFIAIFWEESLFNNVLQDKGTAWGFGQVEPAELYKVERPRPSGKGGYTMAEEKGYVVEGLPPRQKVGKQTFLMGKLTPEQSVKITAGLLCHNFFLKGSKINALYIYAGVGYSGEDVPERLAAAGSREALVAGWLECEAHLQRRWTPPKQKAGYGKPGVGYGPSAGKPAAKGKTPVVTIGPEWDDDYTMFVKRGLYKAKKFHLDDKAFDDTLFPRDPDGLWRPHKSAGWLLDYMKAAG